MALTYVKASCHCGDNVFQIPLLTSTLPQENTICHCDSCRHITGQMFTYGMMMEGLPLAADSGTTPETHKPADLSKLVKYQASSNLTRHFCSKCTAYILFNARSGDKSLWFVGAGALERTEGLIKVKRHIFVKSTLDGGAADHIRHFEGKEVPRYEGWPASKPLNWGWKAESITNRIPLSDSEDRLKAYCHCKTISLYITRPKQEEAKDPTKFWLIPADEDDPKSRPRYISAHCPCNSCRLTAGSLLVTNIIIPCENMFDAHTDLPVKLVIPKDGSMNPNRPKGLVQYCSSPGGFRESCGTCGASVFLWSKKDEGTLFPVHEGEEARVILLHMGLLDEKEGGARREDWISFHNEVIHGEDGLDKSFVEAVQAGIKAK